MPPKSKWRSADAQHFTLVHRSQRDPLIHDPDAPDRILAPTQRRRGAAGQPVGRTELEDEFKGKERSNIGEAANYGVYYDDTEYDYMQHLRPIGGTYNSRRGGKDEEDDVDVVMLPGPAVANKGKQKQTSQIQLKEDQLDLPSDVLASKQELPREWSRGTEEKGGLRPDMDPHLRQALEALDDEAFLARRAKKEQQQAISSQSTAAGPSTSTAEYDETDNATEADEDDDDFDALFAEVVAGGEYDPNDVDTDEEEWRRQAPGGDEALYLTPGERAKQKLVAATLAGQAAPEQNDQSALSLSERVALFKEGLAPGVNGTQADDKIEPSPRTVTGKTRRVASSVGGSSIFGDGTSGKKTKAGSKARHAMSFYAPSADGGSTAWSMSSSAMERNAGLQHVDEGFDRMEQIYEQDEDDDFAEDDDEEGGEGFVREDFENILDEFLEKHEVIGGKMRQRLGAPDATPAEKLAILRNEVGSARIDQWLQEKEETMDEVNRDIESRVRVVGLRKDDWDVETIQTTKTNVSNHPRMLSSVASRSSYRPGTLAGPGSSAGSLASGDSAGFESIPKIRVNKRTGVSEVVGWTKQRKSRAYSNGSLGGQNTEALPTSLANLSISDEEEEEEEVVAAAEEEDDDDEGEFDSGEDTETEESVRAPRQQTVKRDRFESKEEKKARKEAAKTIKQGRKAEKAQRKAEFAKERKRQVKMDAGRAQAGGPGITSNGGRLA